MRAQALQQLALFTAEARSLQPALDAIVDGLAREPGVALARLWLLLDEPGSEGAAGGCKVCGERGGLHLVASAGAAKSGQRWDRVDGDFHRMKVGERKVGLVASSGRTVLIDGDAAHDPLIARPQWAAKEGIQSFCGQPLVFRGRVLGVLAVFSRKKIDADGADVLRAFAGHAAVSLANARAFDELDRLQRSLERERDELKSEVAGVVAAGPLLGESAGLAEVRRRIALVAPTDANVLVSGESGTGKELVATALHEQSPRRQQPLVRVNCAAIPAELFESEFFGHVKGAFTGALRDRAGKLQLADRGTLFLDEVGEIPLHLQGKLLRALQERSFERVGEDKTRTVDVRIVAATHRDLKDDVATGRFREDLYFRLSVFPIALPPLRERTEDLPLLVERFVADACRRQRRPSLKVRHADLALLAALRWPGNVRELMNVIERAVILSPKDRLRLDLALPEHTATPALALAASTSTRHKQPKPYLTQAEWKAQEKQNLTAALAAAGNKIWGPSGAAALLGMKPTTLASRLKALGIVVR